MQNNLGANTEEKGLLDDLYEVQYLRPASQGQRLANFLIDYLIGTILSFAFAVSVLIVILAITGDEDTDKYGNLAMLLLIVGLITYYTGFEAGNKGRTIGKLITGTYAVRSDDKPLTFQDAFLRSLCRIVPFEAFSGFGDAPWHDAWTNTKVVVK
jgi:uncharacterized RDD family membrane protein YckC